ncbi:MAG: hypothetical protein R3C14_32045 [Caldilineaceae bacterium]
MNMQNVTKLCVAIVLTLALTLGSGIVAEQIGLTLTPTVYACGNSGGGGC